MSTRPQRFTDATATIDWLIETVGRDIRLAAPLGLAKAATLMNELYRRAKADPSLKLSILTALSLDVPEAGSDLEARIMDPIVARVFGDYPGLDYLRDLRRQALPANVVVSEFFFQPGAMLGNDYAQRHYRSVNYTHAGRDIMASGVNVFMQMVAPGLTPDQFSLSSNTDVTLDLVPVVEAARQRGDNLVVVGQINDQMPIMTRSALVDASLADAVFEGPAASFKPFGAPAMPVSDADYLIALRVATLLADGGTLQIGIGSLSDAIAYCCDFRQNHNAAFRNLVERMRASASERALVEAEGGLDAFTRGLYGCTEMLVDAYIHLYRSGVIKRVVYDDAVLQRAIDAGAIDDRITPETLTLLREGGSIRDRLNTDDVDHLKALGVFKACVTLNGEQLDAGDDGPPIDANLADESARGEIESRCLGARLAGATLVHGGFFLGPTAFYDRLKALDDNERDLFHMTGVGEINDLYGGEDLRRAQRPHARFINTAIKATVTGAVAADALENDQVLSGVGGQYNFVAQAHELAGARSIICVRAVRSSSSGAESNIVSRYGHTTIPRHLRDIVVTEYGVADLRGKTDEDIAIAMIEIADARFQDELRSQAIADGKLSRHYEIPEHARRNTPERLHEVLAPERVNDDFPVYPYGSDFTDIELALIGALKGLQGGGAGSLLRTLARNASLMTHVPASATPYLERMNLAAPQSWREKLQARIVSLALINHGTIQMDGVESDSQGSDNQGSDSA